MKTNKKYMVVQIGCIECGVSSYPIGIYNTLKKAKKSLMKSCNQASTFSMAPKILMP